MPCLLNQWHEQVKCFLVFLSIVLGASLKIFEANPCQLLLCKVKHMFPPFFTAKVYANTVFFLLEVHKTTFNIQNIISKFVLFLVQKYLLFGPKSTLSNGGARFFFCFSSYGTFLFRVVCGTKKLFMLLYTLFLGWSTQYPILPLHAFLKKNNGPSSN